MFVVFAIRLAYPRFKKKRSLKPIRMVRDFRNIITNYGLLDLFFRGYKYTRKKWVCGGNIMEISKGHSPKNSSC